MMSLQVCVQAAVHSSTIFGQQLFIISQMLEVLFSIHLEVLMTSCSHILTHFTLKTFELKVQILSKVQSNDGGKRPEAADEDEPAGCSPSSVFLHAEVN